MDIKSLINSYLQEIDEKKMSNIIETFKANYIAYLDNLDMVNNHRKLALSLSLISRKEQIAKYIKSNDNVMSILDRLSSDTDIKVRKNIYSTYANLKVHIDRFYDLLSVEDSYINIVHLLDIMSHYDGVDFAKLNAKTETIDKSDAYYLKAQNILNKLGAKSQDKLILKELSKADFLCLTTPKYASKILENDLIDNGIKIAEKCSIGALISSNNNYDDIMKVRSFFDLLIAPHQRYRVPNNMTDIASFVSEILDIDYFNRIFGANRDRYSYRIEIKDVDNDTRAKLSRHIASNVNANKFVNIRDNYDFEVLIYPSLKFADIFIKVPYIDNRFDYRINELPASINPVTASIIAGLIKPYVIDKANVLDGFVGTGTMLYEYYMRYGDSKYVGVDIEAKAITYAKQNIGDKIPNISLVNNDITRYEPEERFDTIISNMPFGTRVLRHDAIVRLYNDFARRLNVLLRDEGRAFLLTTNGKQLRESLRGTHYKIIKEFRVTSGGLMPYLFVISR